MFPQSLILLPISFSRLSFNVQLSSFIEDMQKNTKCDIFKQKLVVRSEQNNGMRYGDCGCIRYEFTRSLDFFPSTPINARFP